MYSQPIKRPAGGFVILTIVGLIALIVASVMGAMLMASISSTQGRVAETERNLDRAKSVVLDFVRQNQVLPSIVQFQSLTVGLTDAWGRSFLYFPNINLMSGDVGAVSSTNISVNQCGDDVTCAPPSVISNIPFLLLSGGGNINSTADVAGQTTSLTTSTVISAATVFKQYKSGLDVGPYATPTTSMRPYDDQLTFSALPEIKAVAQSLAKSQGDVLLSGGALQILNTDPLPPGSCGISYSKTLTAYGMETGAFTWSFGTPLTTLPPGLGATPSGKSVVISGLPTTEGAYTVQATITDPNSRSVTKNLGLTIISVWNDTGNTSSTSCSASGGLAYKEQRNSCTNATQNVLTSNTCCNWTDTGAAVTASCGDGFSGSITQQLQTNSCTAATQTITTANTCTAYIAVMYDGRFQRLQLEAAGAALSNVDTGKTSLTIGTGTSQITISAAANITLHSSTSTASALGVLGNLGNAIDSSETINIVLNGGYAKGFGLEFRGLGIKAGGGADPNEDAIVTLKNTTTGITVGTYTLTPSVSCSNVTGSEGLTGTTGYRFSKPDVVAYFNRIEIQAGNSPATTNFYVRGLRLCAAGETPCYSSGTTGATCP
jgi:hypothetical protein